MSPTWHVVARYDTVGIICCDLLQVKIIGAVVSEEAVSGSKQGPAGMLPGEIYQRGVHTVVSFLNHDPLALEHHQNDTCQRIGLICDVSSFQ
jgi:hypothetical protein